MGLRIGGAPATGVLALIAVTLTACGVQTPATESGVAPSEQIARPPDARTPLLEALVQSYVNKGEFSGAVLVAQDGAILFKRGFRLRR
jgi:hypothetical protein